MYERISEAAPSTLNYMAWSLYIFSSRCFAPGTETHQLMLSAQACVQKLTEILPLVQYLQPESQQLLLQLAFLSLGNVLHMH